MGTPANSLNLTTPGIVKYDGVSTFSSTNIINHSVLVGHPGNNIASVFGQSGQLLQSNGLSVDPAFTTATYPSTAGANGNVLTSNGTNWTSAAPSGGGVSSVTGTANRITSTGGATPVIDIDAAYVGQSSITTLGTVATGTWSATTIAANKGGTGTVTNTNHGVLIGQAASAIAATSAGSSGQHLQSQGSSADPTWTTATFPATATGTNKILVADGTNWVASTPTFPNASATTRKIIVSDGTNWTASTETYATPSTSGNVMTSDGTNWTSATAPSGTLLTTTLTLTNSQIKNIKATPIQIIAAPGSGKGIIIVSGTCKLIYGGTNVFTAASGQRLDLYYNNNTTSCIGNIMTNSTIISSASKFSTFSGSTVIANQSAGIIDNVNIAVTDGFSGVEIGGNAANDNTISITLSYWIATF